MDDSWFNKHDNWIEQLREFLGEHGIGTGEDGQLDDETLMFVSNLAAGVARGRMTMHAAAEKIREFIARQMGYVDLPDREAFDLEAEIHDLVDVTEGVKANLLMVDQPGIADALMRVFAHPNLVDDGSGMFRSDDPADEARTAIAIQSKTWFRVQGMHPNESKALTWAVVAALGEHVRIN